MKISNFAKKVILPMLCILALAPMAHATGDLSGTSTATVGFTEGALTLTDPSQTHTNFDFLTHELPFAIPTDSDAAGQEYPYPSKTAGINSYKLVITDARSANEPWVLQAQMTPYVHTIDGSNTFNGIVLLAVGEKTFTYDTDDTNMTVEQDLQLISDDGSALPVIQLAGALSRDEYTVSWTPDQVSFRFTADTDVSKLIQGSYQATITWTIVTDVDGDEG